MPKDIEIYFLPVKDLYRQNFRITNLQAAIGCAQLKHLNKIIKRK